MSGTQVTSDAELARLLGVDRALVSRDKRRGMPTQTLEAAQTWRQANLRARVRTPTRNELQHLARQAEDAAIRKVVQLMQLGHSALDAGHFHLVANEVRGALRAVPVSARDRVLVSAEVMDALCEPEASVLQECQAALDRAGPSGTQASAGQASEAAPDSLSMQRFWYALAAGEDLVLVDAA